MTRLRTWAVAAPLLAALQLAAAPPARAQARPPESAAHAALTAERVRVRAELDRVNAEIDGLKRNDRGMRNDYRLRSRLADAEALARRLTEIDARLGGAPAAGAPAGAARLGSEPTLAPTDGPAEMEAKADILADQARRIGAEAVALDERAHQLKGRQELRRRSGLMEHDPFSPLEGSKRRMSTGATPRVTIPEAGGQNALPPPPPNTSGGSPTGSISTDAPAVPGAAAGGARSVISAPVPPTPTGGTGASADAASPLSVQLRNLLDPATLVELRRLESSGTPRSGVEALERAATALRARAERLQGQSQSLRARAHQR